MRSISVKITFVLVVVSLAGALFTSFYVQNRTQQAFDTFIKNQDEQILVQALKEHYLINENWENVDLVFQKVYPFILHNAQAGEGAGNPNRTNDNNIGTPFYLVSPNGDILSKTGQGSSYADRTIPQKELENGIPIEIDNEIVAWLVPAPYQNPRNNTQQNFLETVQQGLIISSLVTLLIALSLGGFLIQSFTRPIRKLASATEAVASGDLGYQVDFESKDELGKLASSFNSMSTDLERADLTRKQMTADIAHDLRSPLSILHGYTEAMSTGKMTSSPEIFKVMHQQAQHLNYLIDDLRTLTLLDSEELGFQIQNIDPKLVLQQTKAAFSPLASENEIQLTLTIQQDLPRVNLDPDRLTQILGNLINNAIQVLPPDGKIKITARAERENLVIEVIDNGPGISENDIPLLFNRFFRTDQSRHTDQGSSGLGLAITKKLVESQGGVISIQSELGQGTTFTVEFKTA